MHKKSVIIVSLMMWGLASVVFAGELVDPLSGQTFIDIICAIAGWIAGIVGALAVIMFVWGGILFVTSGGNPGQIDKAKQALKYAIIGTAIALAGEGLIQLVGNIIGASGTGSGC